jgi:fibronectin type 3 domain-containing protein
MWNSAVSRKDPVATGMTATAAETAAVLAWDPQQDAATYNVYRGTSAGAENSTAIATGLTDPSYTDTNLTDGNTYYYTIKAVNPIGTSIASAEVSATPAPVAVSGLTATPGDGVVNISFNPAVV